MKSNIIHFNDQNKELMNLLCEHLKNEIQKEKIDVIFLEFQDNKIIHVIKQLQELNLITHTNQKIPIIGITIPINKTIGERAILNKIGKTFCDFYYEINDFDLQNGEYPFYLSISNILDNTNEIDKFLNVSTMTENTISKLNNFKIKEIKQMILKYLMLKYNGICLQTI